MAEDIDRGQLQETLHRVKQRKTAVRRETELFFMFLFGVFFGVLSSLMAAIVDNLSQGNNGYPPWYVLSVVSGFTLVIVLLTLLFFYLRRERKDVAIMERHLEMMLAEK